MLDVLKNIKNVGLKIGFDIGSKEVNLEIKPKPEKETLIKVFRAHPGFVMVPDLEEEYKKEVEKGEKEDKVVHEV